MGVLADVSVGRKDPEGKNAKGKNFENFAEEKNVRRRYFSEDFSDLTFTGIYSISGYFRNPRGRLLSSEKFSEVFALWVFTLKPFPGGRLSGHLSGGLSGSAVEAFCDLKGCLSGSAVNPL